ncbi:MAG: threonine--tRNA ligase [Candidatus Gastranaerophilaceae bacterium]|jgi:threonyl-tRNA synthetase|nr:threonine--tRNA ligase [bacterium]CDE92611.1 threonine--tRNA ligase [Fusobacterium sp. CAG:815]DAA93963.1 MAG TPA: threonine--tRNA ligase [Candidatus Gastranaerophilales bacterium HUM_6]DAA95407.1 MAG TPA: threonine--tRNA ligase [Candidatus Gastranaerophilales bacterium HUM_7]DAB01056.1 MAG TPA: threonine--tRNA ligase [Candidatus Gastranaerophilales bacterium HUM_12]DAB07863.1 MAG TPA: threonine--tRNA ligase [Candidatus Gastranaerophilales bacterium HUM_14]
MEKNNETLSILRHSTSHIMAQAVQSLFPNAKLAIGPATSDGFYYDFDLTDGHAFTQDDLAKIEEKMKEIIKQNLTFEKYVIPDVDKQIEEFKKEGEIYKAELLEEHRNDNPTLYITKDKDGNALFNDLCAGPHLPNTSYIKANAFKLLKVAGAYWRGNEKNKMLQRIYATAYWNKEDLQAYLHFLEEAERRDHRKLGTKLDLFSTREELGAGLVLWHPNLAIVREEIENYWREEHRKRGYVIVNTPHIAKSKLWEISGHYDHYRENMFFIQKDNDSDDQYILKPMNCPFHILIYQANRYSYRSLPLRMAELGTVYRKEKSGALSGLTRVQGFTQDDAHIFCTPEQLVDEINRIIDFVADTLAIFNMKFEVELSTRPDNYIGEIENWDRAEKGLKEAMDRRGMKYDINEGDGAFYGPKIDFKIKDAIGRTWQCATIQLDFNLPERFDIKYQDKDGQLKTPLMLHRVIFGSMERFHGILIEHYAGAFPTWLAPTQVNIVPISNEKHIDFAEEVYRKMREAGIRVNLDDRSESMNYKIRESLQDKKIPYVCVIGDKEIEANSVAVRARAIGQVGTFKVEEFIETIKNEIKTRANESFAKALKENK